MKDHRPYQRESPAGQADTLKTNDGSVQAGTGLTATDATSLEHMLQAEEESGRPLSVAMIGLRGIPSTYGGVERAVEELSAALAMRGHRVTVYARRGYSDRAVLHHRGVTIVHRGQVHTKHLEAASHTTISLMDAMRSRRFDLIHLHASGPALLSFLPALTGIPTVATIQGLDYRREKWGWMAKRALRIAAHAAAVFPDETIVVSKELQRHYRQALGVQTHYIPNGVPDPDSPSEPVDGLEPGRFVLFLGRLVPEKHIHTLINAYHKVDTELPLVIAGAHSHSPQYVEQLRRLAADDPRIRLIGARYGAQKAWLMRHATCFVQPSSVEGLSIALLEALAAGAFPIVSNIPENLEVLTLPSGEQLGACARMGDEEDWARVLAATIERSDRGTIGEALRRHVLATYDWHRIAADTEHVYRLAVDAHRHRNVDARSACE